MLYSVKTGAATAGVAVCALAAWAYLALGPNETATDPDARRADRSRLDAGHEPVGAKSGVGGEIEPAPEPSLERSGDRADATAGTRPVPPDGYSFVSVGGPLTKGTLARSSPSREHDAIPLPDWLGAPPAVDDLARQAAAAGRDWTFGWIRLAVGTRLVDVERALGSHGVAVLGSAGPFVRARVPASRMALRGIATLPGIAGIGAMPPAAKLARSLAERSAAGAAVGSVRAFVTLMDGDPDGRWRRELEALGATVQRFDPSLRVYVADVPAAVLDALTAADFVSAVEPVGVVRAMHDTAVPAMGVDALRVREGSGLFSGVGGASVPVGVMDSGLNASHVDIEANRASVCAANFVPDFWGDGTEEEDLWIDANGHGSHVTGTIAGAGVGAARFAGMAPSVRHLRFAKVLDSGGFGDDDSILSGMDYLGAPSACGSGASVVPLVVNMSLGDCGREFEARTVGERKIDATVWGRRQLYAVAMANAADYCYSNFAAAKNTLAVGAIRDDGGLAHFSSVGPTRDGRLKPALVATGVGLHSARGQGSRGGYDRFSGTSMATPTITGLAALLMDAVPAHGGDPALARARLMASALRPDAWLDAPAAFPATNSDGPGTVQALYGMGKASALTSVLQRDRDDGWTGGSAVAAFEDGGYGHVDIEVPEGAARLDLVMTWDEPPADAIASAVLNDLDLWLDRGADCAAAECGEHASRSRVDNIEWIIARDPEPGIWRVKVTAPRVYTAPPRAAVAWTVIRGASTPALGIQVDRRAVEAGTSEFTVTLWTDAYVAAAAAVDIGCRASADSSACDEIRVDSAVVDRPDGIRTNLAEELGDRRIEPQSGRLGRAVPVGEVAAGTPREVRLMVSHPPSEGVLLAFRASAWNAVAASVAIGVGDDHPAEMARPDNDDFADAESIGGESGSVAVDLLRATREPGEPAFGGEGSEAGRRPAGTVWFAWTAPATGLAAFAADLPEDAGEDYRLDVYAGDRIAVLESVASDGPDVLFQATAARTYRVRLSHVAAGAEAVLRWRPGKRPANDDFESAALLSGAEGEFQGSLAGATLQRGEWFGGAASTVWHRWVAPGDGWWFFEGESPREVVAVFEGESPGALRLVSGYHPESSTATFPAGAGRAYRILVAGKGAFRASDSYRLRWAAADAPFSNDLMEFAEPLGDASPGNAGLFVFPSNTVSPDERVETGVRTAWYGWNAPTDGRYTWRVAGDRDVVVALFGELVGEPPLATIGPRTDGRDVVVEAEAGETLLISSGIPIGADATFAYGSPSATLSWGPAPANDGRSRAMPLSGPSGTVSGSNRFAATGSGERSALLGRNTLWWTYEADESGWVRLEAGGAGGPWALAVLRPASVGEEHEPVRSSRWRPGSQEGAEVTFEAEAGVAYAIVLGVHGGGSGGEFELTWRATEAPAWIVHAGTLEPWGADARGNPVELREPGAMAFNGAALYVASASGLHVFDREPATGALARHQTIAGDLGRNPMVWDPHRGRLLVQGEGCDVWRPFRAGGGGLRLEEMDGLATADSAGCGPDDRLVLDSGGTSMYRVGGGRIDVFRIDASGDIEFHRTVAEGARRAAVAPDGEHVYAITYDALVAYRRDPVSGDLEEAGRADGLFGAQELALGDGVLYAVFGDFGDGPRTALFSLAEPAMPERLDTAPRFFERPFAYYDAGEDCLWASVRAGVSAGDVVCSRLAYSVAWDAQAARIAGTDFVAPWQPDRNNAPVPDFADPSSAIASPDGRQVYVADPGRGILVFERIGARSGSMPVSAVSVPMPRSVRLAEPAPTLRLQSVLRIVNHSARSGEVRIDAFDHAGTLVGDATFSIGAEETVDLSRRELEKGAPGKGLPHGVGTDRIARLDLTGDLAIEAFLTIAAPF